MIIEIPDENSIVKWKNDDKDEWKVAEISDLIKVYERPQGEWILPNFYGDGVSYECDNCHIPHEGYIGKDGKPYGYNFCPNCGADMRGEKE